MQQRGSSRPSVYQIFSTILLPSNSFYVIKFDTKGVPKMMAPAIKDFFILIMRLQLAVI
jgi:hypothetical protein